MNICKLIINDEVNIKLDGLDPKTRRQCVDALKYKIPNAHFMRTVRLGRWDGIVSFMTIGGGTYLNLFPRVYDIIKNNGYDFVVEDKRQSREIDLGEIDKNYFADTNWGKGHRLEGQPIILDDHQVESINVLLKKKQGLVEAATGAGKTIITAALSKKVQHLGRSIVIVPSKDLVLQTEKDYITLGLDAGVFYGKRKEFNKTHTICTWQSLNRLNENTKDGLSDVEIAEFLDDVIMFLVDEAHLAPGQSIQKLLSGPFANTPLRWGLTGTVPKEPHLKTAIESTIGEVLHVVPANELQEKGFLSNCHVNIIQFIDEDAVRAKGEEPKHEEWSQEDDFLATDSELLQKAANSIIDIAKNGNTFVLTSRRPSCETLQSLIPGSVYFHGGKKDTSSRQEAYDDMNDKDNQIIIATFGIASTGINIPRIFNLVLYNPGKSFTRVIQSIGRGLRKAKDKDFVNITIICTTNKWSSRHLTKIKSFLKEAKYPFTHKKIK